MVSAQTYTNRVKGDLADPYVFEEDGIYYAYGTDFVWAGFWVYTSTNLVKWSSGQECLAENKNGIPPGDNFWAPEVIKKNDYYYMFYTRDYGLHVARSTSPLGPFSDWATLRTNEENGGQWAIDGHYFKDDDDNEYMYYARIGVNGIWVADLADDLKSMSNDTLCFSDVSHNEAWVHDNAERTNEAPQMIKHNGKYYLFYSGNGWMNDYAVGYALADSPKGPWTKYSGNPILQGNGTSVICPGHNSFAFSPDKTERFIVYHTIYKDKRGINIDRINFDGTAWVVNGPTTTPQPYPSGVSSMVWHFEPDMVSVYPNPCKDQLYIESDHDFVKFSGLSLYDIQGRSVLSIRNESVNRLFLPVGFLEPGMYVLKITRSDGSVLNKTIIKE